MICQDTWPNYRHGSDKDGTRAIIDGEGYGGDVQYGKTKIFIRHPQTIFALEQKRSSLLPGIVLLLQKARNYTRQPSK